jgi:cell division protein FtsI (penicillin-binding protein 3)
MPPPRIVSLSVTLRAHLLAAGPYVSVFAGVVPVDNPRFAMAVVINEPTQGSYYGGLVAGPVFHNVMEGALRLMDVPPDDIDSWLAAQAKAEARARGGKPAVAAAPPVDEPGNDDVQAVTP